MKTIIEYIQKKEKPIISHGELWDMWTEFKDVRLRSRNKRAFWFC